MSGIREEHPALPQGWTWGTISEIANLISGQHILKENYNLKALGVPYLTGPDDFGPKSPTISKWTEKPKAIALENDTLITVKGAGVGKVNLLGTSKAAISRQLMAIRSDQINSSYIYYYFKSIFPFLQKLGAGSTVPGIDRESILGISIPIAPVNEQVLISAKIEELFSRLDAGVEALRRARTQLQRYRQSVLQAAVEGRLTAEWREAHPEVEPAEKLLEQILKRKKKIESFRLNAESPFDIPRDWAWTELGLILSKIEAGKNFRCVERSPSLSEVGVVKVSAVSWGEFDETQSKTSNDPSRINANYFIKENDFLFSRANTIDLVGACVIVENVNHQLMLSDKILRFSFIEVPSQWILYVLRSRHGRNEIESLATGNQESMRNIGQDRIKRIKVPIPPKSEISEIIKAIRYFLSIASTIEKSIECNLKIGIQLRQSILQRAFQGRLVPQDPSDEPASLLLERIRAERINEAPRRGRKSKAQQARLLQ